MLGQTANLNTRVRLRVAVLCASLVVLASGCEQHQSYPDRPITLICPWAAGGGTDRVSRQMAMHLERELGVPVNVVNATGGKGVTGHRRGLRARADGYTVAMITLELNTMHWSGLTGLTCRDCEPLMSVNEDYAALFVRNDAPWKTVADLEMDIRSAPGKLTASGTALGGAWHLALAGWLIAADIDPNDVKWISSTGAGPSLQQLISGGVDMVCCSLPEARALYEAGEVRTLGVMAPARARGFRNVATFSEQDREWTLGGWRGLAVPKGTPPHITRKLVAALHRIVTGQTRIVVGQEGKSGQRKNKEQTFPAFMQTQGFDNTWRPPGEFAEFMEKTDQKFGKLLNSPAMKSVNQEPFNPMIFPYSLFGMLAVAMGGLAVRRVVEGTNREPIPAIDNTVGAKPMMRFITMIGIVIAFVLLVDTVGFVLLVALLMLLALLVMGTRLWLSIFISIITAAGIFQFFANVLRVPLPRGWLGW